MSTTQPLRSPGGGESGGLAGSAEDTFIRLWEGSYLSVSMRWDSERAGSLLDSQLSDALVCKPLVVDSPSS